ncbi:hypothetical protein VA596_24500 [Amycolatopsis sp., V23-08]|uniref:Uncharacterized protein n=1 Tax=Amycolatopsis heterodermiae TaxID=3110235 RepID=A0ABU5RAS0_9PSEU|nr:hypothetical protein [Amycolatopsis sp., V23-08]MEA5362719.1 hypothetical protein [Amycolatopsis sp., V23-08]
MLGADRTWSPERVAELLGDDYGDNPSDHSLGRDHGLAEFFWQRSGPGQPWEGTHFSVQAHRLRVGDPELISPVLRERYGIVPVPVPFADVAALLEARDVALAEVPYPVDPAEMRTYWQPGSRTLVYVVAGSYYGRAGDVYKLVNPSSGTP